MRATSRRVHAAGVVSVALVAVARVARPSRRVTCVRLPGRPLEPLGPASDHVPPDDDGVGQPTEVMATVAPAPALEPTAVPAPALEPAPPPTPAPEPAPVLDLDPILDFAPPPEFTHTFAPRPAPTPPPEPTRTPVPPREAEPQPAPALEAGPRRPTPTAAQASPPDPWGWAEPWGFDVPAAERTDHQPPKPARRGAQRRRRGRGHPLVAVAVIVPAIAVSVWVAAPRSSSARAAPTPREVAAVSYSPPASAFALRTIPAAYLRDYSRAANEYGLDWTKLAAVGQIESDQGRSHTPGVAQGTNPHGAAGPAQFLASTWARYGVDADGHGAMNPYDPADAITAMAAYLKASGAPEDWSAALFAYNHSTPYVQAVLALSRRYVGP